MKKIPTLYRRDPNDMRHVTDEVTPGCEWVLAGEGIPTRKYDGTCMMLDDDGAWWARREVKPGKTPPPNYQPIETDPNTGKTVGWEPAEQSPFAKFWREAVDADYGIAVIGGGTRQPVPGTYELIGPKINGNPEGPDQHVLVQHGYTAAVEVGVLGACPDNAADLRTWITALGNDGWEGIVWHHPDGRMAKLKVRDYE